MCAVRPVDPVDVIPSLSSFCCGVSSLIRRSAVRIKPSARPRVAEALQPGKANSYPEYGCVSVRPVLCLLLGSPNGREVAMLLCWWDLLKICPLGYWAKLFIERCLKVLRYVGMLGDAGQAVWLSTLHCRNGAVEKQPGERIELPPSVALQRPLLTKPGKRKM